LVDGPNAGETRTSASLADSNANPGTWRWNDTELVARGRIGTGGAPWTLYSSGRLVIEAGMVGTVGATIPEVGLAANVTGVGPWVREVSNGAFWNTTASFRTQVTSIEITGTLTVNASTNPSLTLASLFGGMPNLVTITGLEYFNTIGVTNMANMFDGASSLISLLDIYGWDVSGVTTFESMFRNASSLTAINVSDWNVGGNANLNTMFDGVSSLTELDLTNWDTRNIFTAGSDRRSENAFRDMTSLRKIILGPETSLRSSTGTWGNIRLPNVPNDGHYLGTWIQTSGPFQGSVLTSA